MTQTNNPATETDTLDPTSCFFDIVRCVQEGDIDEARHIAKCLHEWLANGGFPPQVDPYDLDHLTEHERGVVQKLLDNAFDGGTKR